MLKSLRIGISLVGLSLSLGASPASSEDTLRVGAMDGGIQGYLTIPALETAYKRAGIDMKIQLMPGKRVLAEFENRRIDGVTSRIFSLPDHIQGITRIEPSLISIKIKAYVRAGSGIEISERDDLSDHSVVVPSGSIASKRISESARSVIEVRAYTQLLGMLINERVDVVVAPEAAVEIALARNSDFDGIEAAGMTLGEEPLYHYLDERFADRAALVSRELQKMSESGEMKELYDIGWQRMLADAGAAK